MKDEGMGTDIPGKKPSVATNAGRMLAGYFGIIRKIVGLVLILLCAAAVGTLIVFPLWAFATGSPGWYSVFVGVIIVSVLLYAGAFRMLRALKEYRNPSLFLARAVLPFFRKILIGITAAVFFYCVLLLYANVSVAAGVVATILYLILAGYLLFVRRPQGRTDQTR